MLQPLLRAVSQLNDSAFLGVVWRSLALSLLSFVGLLAGSVWLLERWVGQGGWLGWLAGLLGGLGVLLLAVWLFVPIALLIATFYVDRVAAAVERRFYPGLPRAAGAPLAEQGWDGAVLALQVLLLQIVTLVFSVLLPGVGLVLGYAVTGWPVRRRRHAADEPSGRAPRLPRAATTGSCPRDPAGAAGFAAAAQSAGPGGRDCHHGACLGSQSGNAARGSVRVVSGAAHVLGGAIAPRSNVRIREGQRVQAP